MEDPNEVTIEHKSAQAPINQPKTEKTRTEQMAQIKAEEDDKRRTTVLAIIRKLS
jgi:hypothetical protein